MKTKQLRVLVTGATGRQGGAVAHHLLRRGHEVHAMTRKPESPAARALRDAGARILVGDLNEPGTYGLAMREIDSVFLVTTPFERGVSEETRWGQLVVDVATEANIGHVVFSSVAGADQDTNIPHFDSKYAIELHLRASDLPSTIIAPVFFMENFCSPWLLPSIRAGTLPLALPPARRLQMIAVDDIGAFATHALENRDALDGRRVELASDELSAERATHIIAKVSEHKLAYHHVPLDTLRAKDADMAKMFDWLTHEGYRVDIADLAADYPEIGWHDFGRWAKQQDWKRLLTLAPAA